MSKKQVLLYSGGLDSAAAWWLLGKPDWLHFPVNPAAEEELSIIKKQVLDFPEFGACGEIVEMDWLPWRREGRSEFPREQLCAVLAWARGYDEAWTGWHADDGTLPNSMRKHLPPGFTFPHLSIPTVDATGYQFVLLHPLMAMGLSRTDAVRAALRAGAPPEFLLGTFSCNTPAEGNTHCGSCLNCTERRLSFMAIDIEDTTEYRDELFPCIALREHVSDPGYEQQTREALGLSDEEMLSLDGRPVSSLDGLDVFKVGAYESPTGLVAVPDNGATVSRIVLAPAGRRLVHTVYEGPPARLKSLLHALAITEGVPLFPLMRNPGQMIDVYIKLESGSIEAIQATYK